MFKLQVWTDGSCRNNPGPGGFAAIIVAKKEGVPEDDVLVTMQEVFQAISDSKTIIQVRDDAEALRYKIMIVRGREENTTNNRMELAAIISAIEELTPCKLTVFSDSKYAIRMLSGNFRTAKANVDLIKRWQNASKNFQVEFIHVNGHQNIGLNEYADMLAGKAYE